VAFLVLVSDAQTERAQHSRREEKLKELAGWFESEHYQAVVEERGTLVSDWIVA